MLETGRKSGSELKSHSRWYSILVRLRTGNVLSLRGEGKGQVLKRCDDPEDLKQRVHCRYNG
jgi:hypothetical protein